MSTETVALGSKAEVGRSVWVIDMLRPLAESLIAILIAVVVGGILVALMGSNPLTVYGVLIQGGFSGWANFAVTLQATTPLLFTGLAVAISSRAGLLNIGTEGQMLVGALAAGIVGYAVPMPAILHIPACFAAAFLGGMAWASIPVMLRVWLGINELIVCLMLNPVALLLTGWVSTQVLKAPGPTNKLPDVLPTAVLPSFSVYSQLNAGIILGLVCCVAMAAFNTFTVRGMQWKIMGLNPRFAYYGGINVPRNAIAVMLLSGGIAGFAGAEQVTGEYYAYFDNFSPGYGFDGIAVAMLAQFNPLGVVLAALLFGALSSGSSLLQMMTGLSKHLVQVLQFIIVLVLAAQFSWHWLAVMRLQDKKYVQPNRGEH